MVGLRGALFSFCIFDLFTVNSQNSSQFDKTLTPRPRDKSGLCIEIEPRHFSRQEKYFLALFYNSLRGYISMQISEKLPRAVFMKKLTWNDTLEEMAKSWAEECKDGKDVGLDESIGQHIVESENSGKGKLKDLLKTWTSGLSRLPPDVIDKYRKPERGKYDYEPLTQILWWDTEHFGCGRSVYKRDHGTINRTVTMVKLVCNYSPAGNKLGDPVYVSEINKRSVCNTHRYDFCSEESEQTVREGSEKKGGKNDVIEYRIRNRVVELWPAKGAQINTWQMFNVKLLYLNLALAISPFLNIFLGFKINVNYL